VKCDKNGCNALFTYDGSTGNMKRHLAISHPASNSSQPSVEFKPYSRQHATQARAEQLFILAAISKNLPFTVFEGADFARAFRALDARFIAPSRSNFVQVAQTQLLPMALESIRRFVSSVDYVAMTTDCWTSRNMQHFISCTIHGFALDDQQLALQSCVAAMIPYNHQSTGSLLAEALFTHLHEFALDVKTVAFVADNASNMTTTFEKLKAKIPTLKFRLGCVAHVLNLVVQNVFEAGIFPSALAKLRALVKKIGHSLPLKNALGQCQADEESDQSAKERVKSNPIRPRIDVKTRWSSTNEMITSALRIKSSLRACTKADTAWICLDLTDDEWITLELLSQLLKPLATVTGLFSGEAQVSISIVLPIIARLLRGIQVFSERNNILLMDSSLIDDIPLETLDAEIDNFLADEERLRGEGDEGLEDALDVVATDVPSITPLISSLWTSLNQRYKTLSSLTVLQLATVLDPRWKLKYLPQCDVKKHLTEFVQGLHGDTPPTPSAQPTRVSSGLFDDEEDDDDADSNATASPHGSVEIEVQRYLDSKTINRNDDPLVWWHSHRHVYGRLFAAARVVLCIPASSTPSERLFSFSGNTVSTRRHRLSGESIEMCALIASNLSKNQHDVAKFFQVSAL
jgi:zinc finger BED domain-containing protein 1 (E3 SUMO-protein ligase ZBED1)